MSATVNKGTKQRLIKFTRLNKGTYLMELLYVTVRDWRKRFVTAVKRDCSPLLLANKEFHFYLVPWDNAFLFCPAFSKVMFIVGNQLRRLLHFAGVNLAAKSARRPQSVK